MRIHTLASSVPVSSNVASPLSRRSRSMPGAAVGRCRPGMFFIWRDTHSELSGISDQAVDLWIDRDASGSFGTKIRSPCYSISRIVWSSAILSGSSSSSGVKIKSGAGLVLLLEIRNGTATPALRRFLIEFVIGSRIGSP